MHAAPQEQAISDSSVNSTSAGLPSESANNGNGNGQLGPHSAYEANGCVALLSLAMCLPAFLSIEDDAVSLQDLSSKS